VALFNHSAGIKTTQIPYKGGGPAVADLLGGQVQFIMAVPVNVVAHVQAGKLRALAVTGDARLSALPNVPSFAEVGYPQVSLKTWHGLGAPAGTPRAILDKISAEVEKLVSTPETRKLLEQQGFLPFYNNPDKTAAMLRAEVDKYAKIVKDADIKSE
jgi:tripartite-type tricarboxylate transporter receptor subunit TctC